MAEARWNHIPASDVAAWNGWLLRTDASLHQFPYWNEPYRRVRCTPNYLAHGPHSAPDAYACVLTLGLPPLRIGLVHRGPVLLGPGGASAVDRIESLLHWARRAGVAFLRFTHTDAALLEALAATGPSERIDSFPFHRGDPKSDLVVPLPADEHQLLASYRKDARREIRRDLRRGYEIRREENPEALAEVWPMFVAHSRRRGFRHLRPLSWWLDVMRHAQPDGCAYLYVASLRGTPVAADLYVRDRNSVRSITAWDEAALGGAPSPSTFLAWHAMHDLRQHGIRDFTLGPAAGSLLSYKRRFHPREQVFPEPVTLIANETSYRLWKAAILPLRSAWPRVRRALRRL